MLSSSEVTAMPLFFMLRLSVYKLQQLTVNMFFSSVCLGWRAALVLPKAEQILRTNIQPYISSILEALMEPTSRGFSEVRDVFFGEMVEISKNSLNGGGKDKLGDVSQVCKHFFHSFFLNSAD